jgi:O-antigen chain-terminating methyltransferase
MEARQADAAASVAEVETALESLRQALALHTSRLELLRTERERGRRERAHSAGDGDVSDERTALLDPREYREFEDQFRGARDDVRRRQESYLPLLLERLERAATTDARRRPAVLDVGCGRGEFLELLRDAGIPARGIDVNEVMVEECRRRGLDVERAEALTHLRGLPDASMDAVVCFQVVEHLSVTELVELLRLCRQKLRDGGVAIWETVNPLNVVVSASTFYLDPTHERQLHPLLLQFLARIAGFASAEIRFVTPVPDGLKLQEVPGNAPAAEILNANVSRLNDLLFAPQEYAVVAVA